MSSQRTVRLPSRLRAVTVSRSATVRRRTMQADRITGMISSGAVQVAPSTTASMPSTRKPTARCAIGDIRITTGSTGTRTAVAKSRLPSSHCAARTKEFDG